MNAEQLSGDSNVVTAAALTRQFGHLRQVAIAEPVFVTHHGRQTHVLLGIDAYRALNRGPVAAQSDVAGDLPSVDDFLQWMPQGCIVLDRDGVVTRANQVAHAMTGAREGAIVGKRLFDALPLLEGSLVQSYINRAMTSGKPSVVDLPSSFRDHSWIRLETHPGVANTTLILHDITEDVSANRLADPDAATVAALAMHADIGTIRLDVRGRIEVADSWCVALLGLDEERLRGVTIYDLVPRDQRAAFRDLIDPVLSGSTRAAFETCFLTNTGAVENVRGSAVELSGTYGSEGAILVLTRA